MLTIGAAFYSLRDGLADMYDADEAAAIAHEAMQHLTGLSRLERLSRKDELMDEAAAEQYQAAEAALRAGTPLQYVTGSAWFCTRRFTVNSSVLIPRPETEELVAWVMNENQTGSILDIGTGSGCIAVSLQAGLPGSDVLAIDVSPEALAVASANAAALCPAVRFEQLDFLDAAARDALPAFDLIVSNPPYIPISERETLHTNVRDYEPALALFVHGHDALQFYRAIADFGLTHLRPGGCIYCELHRDFAHDAAALFNSYSYRNVEIRHDMHGAPRMLRACR
jgi:release factor glutamine methyltransferase